MNEQFQEKWSGIIEKAQANEDYKKTLFYNPEYIFSQAGIDFPEGLLPRVVEDNDKVLTFVLPPAPRSFTSVEKLKKRNSLGSKKNNKDQK